MTPPGVFDSYNPKLPIEVFQFPYKAQEQKSAIVIKHNIDTQEMMLFLDGVELRRIPMHEVEVVRKDEIPEIVPSKEQVVYEENPLLSIKQEEIQQEAEIRQEEVNRKYESKTWKESCAII